MFFLLGLVLLISSLSAQVSSAAVKRAGFTSLAASTGPNAVAYSLQRTPDGGAYLLNVSFPTSEGYTVPLKIDLSSPKTWVNTPSTYCWNPGILPGLTGGSCGAVAPEPSCQSAPQRMLDYYTSDNDNLWGKSCSANLALGSVNIDCQNLIYAEQTWIQPDGVSAGVLGLACAESIDTAFSQLSSSPLTSMNASASATSTSTLNVDASFLANLFHQHGDTSPPDVLPIVSIAISRDNSGANNAGDLVFGSFPTSNNSLMNITSLIAIPIFLSNFSDPSGVVYDDASMQYTIPIDGIYATNTAAQIFNFNATSPFHMVISTGDTAISLPPSFASAVNSMFIPPGSLASDNATYYVHCDSVAPGLNIVIKNQPFLINPMDMKRHASQSLCISSVTVGLAGHYVLGDLFLRNVLLALDFRSNTLSLSPRPYYRS